MYDKFSAGIIRQLMTPSSPIFFPVMVLLHYPSTNFLTVENTLLMGYPFPYGGFISLGGKPADVPIFSLSGE